MEGNYDSQIGGNYLNVAFGKNPPCVTIHFRNREPITLYNRSNFTRFVEDLLETVITWNRLLAVAKREETEHGAKHES